MRNHPHPLATSQKGFAICYHKGPGIRQQIHDHTVEQMQIFALQLPMLGQHGFLSLDQSHQIWAQLHQREATQKFSLQLLPLTLQISES